MDPAGVRAANGGRVGLSASYLQCCSFSGEPQAPPKRRQLEKSEEEKSDDTGATSVDGAFDDGISAAMAAEVGEALDDGDLSRALRIVQVPGGDSSLPANVRKRVRSSTKKWLLKLCEGHFCDIFTFSKWYVGRVLETRFDPEGTKELKVHYEGWGKKYDQWLSCTDLLTMGVGPVHTHTRARKVSISNRPKPKIFDEIVVADETGRVLAMGMDVQDVVSALEKGDDESKRSRRASQCTGAPSATREPKFEVEQLDEADSIASDEDCNEFLCGICGLFEGEDRSELVMCDGPCLRSFHMGCMVDVDPADVFKNDRWLCRNCVSGEHDCWACKVSGKEGAVGGVRKCCRSRCGKFYHSDCLTTAKGTFLCSYHTCAGCGVTVCPGRQETKALLKCIVCPTAYHPDCLPESAKQYDNCDEGVHVMLCPSHEGVELPPMMSRHAADSAKDFMNRLGFKLPDITCTLPSSAPDVTAPDHDLRHFRLPQHVLDHCQSLPPPYQHISSLQYVSRPAVRMEEGEFCNCEPTVGKNQKSCGDGCLNRELRVECTGMGKPSNEDGKKIVRLKYENCRSGPEVCSNRPFGRLRSQGVLTTVFREPGRGWGLQAAQDVSKGQLIHEYVGEVIDDVEMEERLLIQQRLKPYDHDHYLMVLNQGLYVDAKRKGNNSRFINHSCDPNCIVETWNVAGYTRIGVFAARDIPAGTPLCYDYKFCTSDDTTFACQCGAPTCRGTLAPARVQSKRKNIIDCGDVDNVKGAARQELLKQCLEVRRKQDRRWALIDRSAEKRRLSLTSRYLPGDRTVEIKEGPKQWYASFARHSGIYLPRNVTAGSNMLQRATSSHSSPSLSG